MPICAAVKVRLEKTFQFEAAHRLPHVPEGHKCWRLHGHSYRVHLAIAGEVDERTGWLMDFDELQAIFAPVFDQIDHRYLNEVKGLENPTAENIARWIWQRLCDKLPLVEVRIDETCDSRCIYCGD